MNDNKYIRVVMYTNKVIFDVKNPDVSLSKAIAKVKVPQAS